MAAMCGRCGFCWSDVGPVTASAGEALFENAVDRSRIRLALALLHHLADEEAEQLVLARAIFGDLVGGGREHAVDDGNDGAFIGHLHEAFALDDGARLVAAAD